MLRFIRFCKQVKAEGALGLLKELKQEGYALTCCSYPKSDLVVQLQEEDDVSLSTFRPFSSVLNGRCH